MFRNSTKSFYCHTCKTSSMIDISDLHCPKCSSDFLEESKLQEVAPEYFPRLPESSYSSDSDSNLSEIPEPSLREPPLHSLLNFFLLNRMQVPIDRIERLHEDSDDSYESGLGHFSFERILNFNRERRRHEPASSEAIEALEQINVNKEIGDCECKICGEMFEENEEAKLLLCSHVFHERCLVPWLQIKNSCPVCRKPID